MLKIRFLTCKNRIFVPKTDWVLFFCVGEYFQTWSLFFYKNWCFVSNKYYFCRKI